MEEANLAEVNVGKEHVKAVRERQSRTLERQKPAPAEANDITMHHHMQLA